MEYVISIPLVNRGIFRAYKLIPIPVPTDHVTFMYTGTRNPFLWIDQATQYYFMTNAEWLNDYKVVDLRSYVCRQNQSLLSIYLHENCVVQLLQPRMNIPSTCDRIIVDLYNSV
jgi:hypothetical protein